MPQEDYILKTQYAALTVPEIQDRYLKHRSEKAIRHRLSVLGLTAIRQINHHQPWTDVEISILENNYMDMTANRIREVLLPTHSLRSIQDKIHQLHLNKKVVCGHVHTTKKNPPVRWTQQEVLILRAHYGTMKNQELHETLLPNKSPEQIHNKARAEHLRAYIREPWTEQENLVLIEHAASNTITELAEMLPQRTYNAVYQQLKRLNLTPKPDPNAKRRPK